MRHLLLASKVIGCSCLPKKLTIDPLGKLTKEVFERQEKSDFQEGRQVKGMRGKTARNVTGTEGSVNHRCPSDFF
jgi:hypothetical protein